MANRSAPLLFALSESRELGLAIASEAGIEAASLEEREFEAGEFKLRPLQPVRGRTVFIMQSLAGSSLAPVAQRLLRLLFLAFGLRDAGAAQTVAVVPYLTFARKDRRTQLRDPVTSRYVAQLLEAAGLARVIALDVHNPAAFDNAFRIPTDHLSALPMFAHHFSQRLGAVDFAVASPDIGGIKRTQLLREMLERRLKRPIELLFVEKRRTGAVVSGGSVVGAVAGRAVIVLDDLCASGGTLVRAATALRAAGAASVHVAVTHAPLPAGLQALLAAASIQDIVITDSVGSALAASDSGSGRLTTLPVAPLLGQAIARMVHGIPLAPLLEGWPPPDAP